MVYTLKQVRAYAQKMGYVLERSLSAAYYLETSDGRFVADVLGTPKTGYTAFTSYPHGVLILEEEAQEVAERAEVCRGMRELFA